MSRSSFSRSNAAWLSLLLVVLVLAQPLALPVHEYNLRQDGYTLVYGRSASAAPSGETTRLTPRTKDFYNVARCGTHFLIQSLQQFQELFGAGLACVGLLLSLAAVVLPPLFVRKDEFLSEVSLRAPPVPSVQAV